MPQNAGTEAPRWQRAAKDRAPECPAGLAYPYIQSLTDDLRTTHLADAQDSESNRSLRVQHRDKMPLVRCAVAVCMQQDPSSFGESFSLDVSRRGVVGGCRTRPIKRGECHDGTQNMDGFYIRSLSSRVIDQTCAATAADPQLVVVENCRVQFRLRRCTQEAGVHLLFPISLHTSLPSTQPGHDAPSCRLVSSTRLTRRKSSFPVLSDGWRIYELARLEVRTFPFPRPRD